MIAIIITAAASIALIAYNLFSQNEPLRKRKCSSKSATHFSVAGET